MSLTYCVCVCVRVRACVCVRVRVWADALIDVNTYADHLLQPIIKIIPLRGCHSIDFQGALKACI